MKKTFFIGPILKQKIILWKGNFAAQNLQNFEKNCFRTNLIIAWIRKFAHKWRNASGKYLFSKICRKFGY